MLSYHSLTFLLFPISFFITYLQFHLPVLMVCSQFFILFITIRLRSAINFSQTNWIISENHLIIRHRLFNSPNDLFILHFQGIRYRYLNCICGLKDIIILVSLAFYLQYPTISDRNAPWNNKIKLYIRNKMNYMISYLSRVKDAIPLINIYSRVCYHDSNSCLYSMFSCIYSFINFVQTTTRF